MNEYGGRGREEVGLGFVIVYLCCYLRVHLLFSALAFGSMSLHGYCCLSLFSFECEHNISQATHDGHAD